MKIHLRCNGFSEMVEWWCAGVQKMAVLPVIFFNPKGDFYIWNTTPPVLRCGPNHSNRHIWQAAPPAKGDVPSYSFAMCTHLCSRRVNLQVGGLWPLQIQCFTIWMSNVNFLIFLVFFCLVKKIPIFLQSASLSFSPSRPSMFTLNTNNTSGSYVVT